MLIAVTFLGSLAWSFVFVALPFQVERLSTSGPAGTLAWTGWILGVASLGAVVTGPLWARYGERTDPKAVCVMVQALQGLGFVGTAMARSVIELFIARLVLGTVGSFSTLAFVIAGRETNVSVTAEVRASPSTTSRSSAAGVSMALIVCKPIGAPASFRVPADTYAVARER